MTAPVSDVCWVGPLGALRTLPDVAPSSAQVDVTRVGSIHRGLRGGVTVDSFARKRTWTWQWDLLLEDQTMYLEALRYGSVPGPLRLIDPRRRNRLPEDISTGGSVSGTAAAFATDAGSVSYWRPLSEVSTVEVESLPPWTMLRGVQEWLVVLPSPSENYLIAGDTRSGNGFWYVPVLPVERLRASAWVLAPPSCAVRFALSWRARDGSFIFSSASPFTQPALNEWTELTVERAAPPGAALCIPFLQTNAANCPPSTSIYTTAWSVSNPAMSNLTPTGVQRLCDEPPEMEWRLGGGAPFVVADVGATTYARPGFFGSSFTLYET